MKFFLDFEFIEGFKKPFFGKKRHFIDLISVGIVCEDGRTYYAISTEFNPKDADKWVKENVLSKLPKRYPGQHDSPNEKGESLRWKPNSKIAEEIKDFIYSTEGIKGVAAPIIEFYGYYSDYDWVLFCSLFGRMIDLPDSFPYYCKDLKQTLDEKAKAWAEKQNWLKLLHFDEQLDAFKYGEGRNYPVLTGEHNALSDAKWNKALYDWLTAQP